MTPEENLSEAAVSGGALSLRAVGLPGIFWIPLWAVLTTVALPVALLWRFPFAVLVMLLANLGASVGLFSGPSNSFLEAAGFVISFALSLALVQWLLLRNYLPRARSWFLATSAGVLAGGIVGGIGNVLMPNAWANPYVGRIIFLLPIGCFLGLAHWLVLRRVLPNAAWIVPIDMLGVCSLFFTDFTITNSVEMVLVLGILTLPGLITGGGLWYLLKQAQPEERPAQEAKQPDRTGRRRLSLTRVGLGLAALVPLFFLWMWLYAGSELALAKHEGIYSSVEEAIIVMHSQGWGGATVVSIEDVRASVNQHDGSQPHVWFGGARVTFDRVPEGGKRSSYLVGTNYIRVKEGWVQVPEGAFPWFIGWAMEVYNLEGVNEWIEQDG